VRLTDEQLLGKLIEAEPKYIIRLPRGKHTKRIARLWPKMVEYIERSYRQAKTLSLIHQVLEPVAESK